MKITISISEERVLEMLKAAGYAPTSEQFLTILQDKEFLELLAEDVLTCFTADALDDSRAGDSTKERYGDVLDRLQIPYDETQSIDYDPDDNNTFMEEDWDEDEDEEDSDLDLYIDGSEDFEDRGY